MTVNIMLELSTLRTINEKYYLQMSLRDSFA